MYLGINKKFGFPSRVDNYILKEKYSYPKDMEEMKKKVKMFFESLEEKEIEVTIIPCQSQMIELVEILKKQMIFLGGDTMDEEILVILIVYVIMPIIICTICLIVEIIRNNKRNGEKDFVDEVGEFDLGSLAWLAYVMIFLAIVKLIIKW